MYIFPPFPFIFLFQVFMSCNMNIIVDYIPKTNPKAISVNTLLWIITEFMINNKKNVTRFSFVKSRMNNIQRKIQISSLLFLKKKRNYLPSGRNSIELTFIPSFFFFNAYYRQKKLMNIYCLILLKRKSVVSTNKYKNGNKHLFSLTTYIRYHWQTQVFVIVLYCSNAINIGHIVDFSYNLFVQW